MIHVAPERWAEAAAGKLSPSKLERALAHAERCERCRLAQHRVLAARAAMTEMASAATPELPWDSIRAKIRWELSPAGTASSSFPALTPAPGALESQRPATSPPARAAAKTAGKPWRQRPAFGQLGWGVAGAALLASAGVVTMTALWSGDSSDATDAGTPAQLAGARAPATPPPAPSAIEAAATAKPSATVAAGQPLLGLVTRARGAVQIDGEATGLFERTIAAGAVLASGAGWMDVQLGEGSALAIGPRSSLRIERLDTAAIELSIDGVVDLEVAPRAAGQRFFVRAGAQLIEVHGTQFRVDHRADQTRVSCRHGLVTVREGARAIAVGPGQGALVHTGQPMPPPSPLSADELTELTLGTPYQVPWDDASAVARTTARLELSAPATRRLRLDGIELGAGSVEVRVVRGRHLVETSEEGSAFHRAGWAVVGAKSQAVRFDVSAEESIRPPSGSYQRLRELRARVSTAELKRCVRPLLKQGMSGSFVRIELGVERDGTIGYLNILDTDLPVGLAECVRAVIADVRFVAGPAATVIEKLEL
jgi:ferric-dicitrate binding protein FerR (iron transport regulator)